MFQFTARARRRCNTPITMDLQMPNSLNWKQFWSIGAFQVNFWNIYEYLKPKGKTIPD